MWDAGEDWAADPPRRSDAVQRDRMRVLKERRRSLADEQMFPDAPNCRSEGDR